MMKICVTLFLLMGFGIETLILVKRTWLSEAVFGPEDLLIVFGTVIVQAIILFLWAIPKPKIP